VQTDGRYTNAVSIFPQLYVDILDTADGKHGLHLRTGALFAWPEATLGAVDPIRTILAEDGDTIVDDAKNFHGGNPGGYYGTELDLQIGYRFRQYFYWTLEGAVLFPGESLEDEHGDAVNAYLLENRFEFVF
jgi:hypothetical protein